MGSSSSPSSMQIIEAALSSTTPFVLSYTDPDQKWIIRKHLISLVKDFPCFRPSFDYFSHNNGTVVNLLNASGDLHVSSSTPPIKLVIWLHENYPHSPPIVYVSSNSVSEVCHDHPFVDPSGATTTPYLVTWQYPPSNLSDLVRNFVKLFSLIHPFQNLSNYVVFTHPSIVSKREALDRLSCGIHYDMMALRAETENEIEDLSALQVEMVKRIDITTSLIIGLEREKMDLKKKVKEVTENADILMNWVRVYDKGGSSIHHEDAFEAANEESRLALDCLAEDLGIEDLMYALDQAFEKGVVSFDMYIRQVRSLARQQFFHRARVVNYEELLPILTS